MNYRSIAQRRWGCRAEWIEGSGRFAVLAHCRVLTVSLWPTLEQAKNVKKRLDDYACGGKCNRDHEIVDLSATPQSEPRQP